MSRKYGTPVSEIITKKCKECGTEKPLHDFHRQKSGGLGRRGTCKVCRKWEDRRVKPETRDIWYESNKEKEVSKATRGHLRRTYQLDEFEIDYVLNAEFCEACGVKRGSRRLCVDHDHVTGEVRGLLCSSCNILIGHMKDNPEVFELLVAYLHRTKEES